PRAWPSWIPPIRSSTTSRSATSGCRATAAIAATCSSARRVVCASSAATGAAGGPRVREVMLLVVGVVLGGALGWAIVRVRLLTVAQAERAALQARVASQETLSDELRKQLSQRDLETGDLRGALETERAARAQAETRWDATRQALEEQKRLVDDARERLTDTFRALSADALRQSQSSFLEMASSQLGRKQEAIEA